MKKVAVASLGFLVFSFGPLALPKVDKRAVQQDAAAQLSAAQCSASARCMSLIRTFSGMSPRVI